MADEGEQDVPSCHVPECPLSVDVVMKTSDGKYFGTHLQNLENYAEGFPPESLGKRKRVNHLDIEESSEVASLMLHFMHKQPQPDLRETPIKVLVDFAEAAQKYLIYSAINLCRVVMGNRASEAPLKILAYAIKHNYREVADSAAPHSLGKLWSEAVKELNPKVILLWVDYREQFLALIRDQGLCFLQLHYEEAPQAICGVYEHFQMDVLEEISKKPGNLLDNNWRLRRMGILAEDRGNELGDGCSSCYEGFQDWLEDLIAKASRFPKFSSLM